MIRRPPRSTLFPTRRSSDLRVAGRVRARAPRRDVAVVVGVAGGAEVEPERAVGDDEAEAGRDRKSTRLNSSHANISYAVFCLKKKRKNTSHHNIHDAVYTAF